MKYERLTKWEINKGVKCVKYWQYSQEKIAESLALLEDKIENGTLIELPCKVGDTVYIVEKFGGSLTEEHGIVKGVVTEVEVTIDKNVMGSRVYVEHPYIYSDKNPNFIINRYIFLPTELFKTEAEAEKKLKELQGG